MKRTLDKLKQELDTLTEDVGAYAVMGSWEFDRGLEIQCTKELLKRYAAENDLEVEDKKIRIGKHTLFYP